MLHRQLRAGHDAGVFGPGAGRLPSLVADRRPGRPRDARVDQQIVEATLAELADKGFGGASIESIAGRAGVGKAAIYRRWPNREALLQFVALQVTDVVEPADTGDLRKDLLSVFTPLASQFYVTGAGALLPDLVAEAARDPKIRALLKDLVAERRAVAVHAFERAEARGERIAQFTQVDQPVYPA